MIDPVSCPAIAPACGAPNAGAAAAAATLIGPLTFSSVVPTLCSAFQNLCLRPDHQPPTMTSLGDGSLERFARTPWSYQRSAPTAARVPCSNLYAATSALGDCARS